MQQFTYTQLAAKLGNDYDITDEVWVSPEELVGYINDAIDDAETAIHTMHHEDKYFLTTATLTLVAGTADYAFPADIYGSKVRHLFYNNGSRQYEIERIKDLRRTLLLSSGTTYQYLIVNTTATASPRIRLYPTPQEAGAYLEIWYVRNMARMTTSAAITNVCEIPECINFVTQHVKYNLAKKSRNPLMIQAEDKDRTLQYNLMLEALKDMTVDENNLIPMDLTHYNNGDYILGGGQ